MKGLIEYFIKYPVVGNILMIAILIFGLVGVYNMKATFFPETESRFISIQAVLPGASPEEIEEGIVQKIEETLKGIPGVEEITSTSSENAGTISVELEEGSNPDELIIDIQNSVNSIASFPSGMEPVRVFKLRTKDNAMRLAVVGEMDLVSLKKYVQRIEDEILAIDGISQIELNGVPDEEIEIAFRENDLRKYGITLTEAAQKIGGQNFDITGGTIKTSKEELLIRARLKEYYAKDLKDIVLLASTSGKIIRLNDVATIRDKFSDNPDRFYVNGKTAIEVVVQKTIEEDLLYITDILNKYVDNYNETSDLVKIQITQDRSKSLRERIELLTKNGLTGFLLVCLVLALFLNWRLAFWVALSIPVAMAGMFIMGWITGTTINVISLFGLILVLGILVDDGIVISENIYQKYEEGATRLQAAVQGTLEVFPAVTAAVITTIVSFALFFFIEGRLGEFFRDVSIVVLWTLTFSLVEGAFILPAHIAHSKALKKDNKQWFITKYCYKALFWTRDVLYAPVLRASIRYPFIVFSVCMCALILTFGASKAKLVKSDFFPRIEVDQIDITLKMPSGTRDFITKDWLDKIEKEIWEVNETYKAIREDSSNVIENVLIKLGPQTHQGSLYVVLQESDTRGIKNIDITNKIREKIGPIPQADQLSFGSRSIFGKPVSLSLKGSNSSELELAVDEVKLALKGMKELKDVNDNSSPGLREVNIKLKDKAYTLGLTEAEILRQIRSGFFGTEIQRLQRGKDEVKVWVRYDELDRSSLADLDKVRIQLPGGISYPFENLATYSVERGITSIFHINGQREIRVEADLSSDEFTGSDVTEELKANIVPSILANYPSVTAGYEGQNKGSLKTMNSIKKVLPTFLGILFLIIAFTFRSYFQSIMILLLLPFGLIGVFWGHWVIDNVGLSEFPIIISFLSALGVIALIGIMINDALVFMAAFNQYLQEGKSFAKSLYKAGMSRYRPIILTSITTIVGLVPILWEKSFQAQFLKPMAISISFGLLFVTIIILVILPTFIVFYNSIKRGLKWWQYDEWRDRRDLEPAVEELKEMKLED